MSININDEFKFAPCNYVGLPRAYYIAKATVLPAPEPSAEVGHYEIIVDRSGSMWGQPMIDAKATVEKVLTLDEFHNSEMLVTLISYSSQGDYTVHFERTPVAEIMKPGSAHVENIRRIQATCMTCVSQALDHAKKLIKADETTGIVVHTDGYFNDRSPAEESRKIDAFIKDMTGMKNVFVNTVAYGYADTGILMKLANALSGKCIQTRNLKEMYTALHDTAALLAGRSTPPVVLSADGADYMTLVSVSARKVNGTTHDLKVRGFQVTDDVTVWRYRKVTETAYNASKAPVAEKDTLQPVYAFIRAQLAEGNLNMAKYAMLCTKNLELRQDHTKALTVEQRAAFALDVESFLMGNYASTNWASSYGLDTDTMSVAGLCALLDSKKGDWTLDMTLFAPAYKKRGLKKVPGSLSADGKWIAPKTKLVPNDDPTMVSVSSFSLNNTTANLNMKVYRDADLCMFADGKKVKMVAGKKLDLKKFNDYTLVGDGAVNANVLPIRIASNHLHKALVSGNVLPDEKYDPKKVYEIKLSALPVIDYNADFTVPTGVYEKMLPLKMMSSLLAACLPDGVKGENWTPEQLAELDAVDLTAGLSHSPGSTVPYTDLMTAVSKGEVDGRTSYQIEIMNKEIAGLKQLYSANDYLNKRFTVTLPTHPAIGTLLDQAGLELAVKEGRLPARALEPVPELAKDGSLKKAKIRDALSEGAVVCIKTLAAKTQAGLDAIDDLSMPIFETFFDINKSCWGTMQFNCKTLRENLIARKKEIDAELEALHEQFRPIAFYIGATGLIPESWGDVPALEADKLIAKYPKLALTKAQKEATFFEIGTVIVAVYATNAWFSTPAGVAAAKALATVGNAAAELED